MERDDRRMQAWGWLHQAHARLWCELSRHMETEVGVSLLEHGCTYELASAADQRLRMNDLAALLEVSRSGVTRLVDRLEARGWVRRESPREDRRTTYALLTEEGRRAYERNNVPFCAVVNDAIGSRLTDRDIADLLRIVGKLRT